MGFAKSRSQQGNWATELNFWTTGNLCFFPVRNDFFNFLKWLQGSLSCMYCLCVSFLRASDSLESPLDCMEIQPVHSEGDQSWVFIGRTDAEAETPILWPPHAKSWLIGKDPDAGRDWGQEEEGTTEDEMAGWHHRLNGHESEWTPGVGDGQGGLACCNSWGCKELGTTERLNWTELIVNGCSFLPI